ncbi:O-antigen ligase family protein [Nitratifractor sp.]
MKALSDISAASAKLLLQTLSHRILLTLLYLYAALLPFSSAFVTHTAPYVLSVFWLLEGSFREKAARILEEKPIVWFGIFVCWMALSLLWSSNLGVGLHTFKYHLSMLLIFIIVRTSVSRTHAARLLSLFLTAMFVSEFLSYGIFFRWWQIGRGTPSDPSPFMHHIKYSVFLATTVLILLWKLFTQRQRTPWIVAESLFLLSTTANLFINGGRTGQLGLVVGIIALLFFLFPGRRRWLTLGAGILMLATVFFAAYRLSPNFHRRADLSIHSLQRILHGDFRSSWGLRIVMKELTWRLVRQHPLIGVGIGDAVDEIERSLSPETAKRYPFLRHLPHVHDQFAQFTLQLGSIGLGLYLIFLFSIIARPYRDRKVRAFVYAFLSLYIFASFGEVLFMNFTSVLFTFLLGLFFILDNSFLQQEHSKEVSP